MLLTWRSRLPLVVLVVECALYVAASAFGMSDYFLFPLLFALFSCVTRPPARQVLVGAGSVWAVMTFSAFVEPTSAGFTPEYLGRLLIALATTALAVATRSIHGWRVSRERALDEALRSEKLVRQRDRAVSRTRIAAELHDSVGHGLTTIIALTEGLAGATGDAEIDEALAGINSVARESLQDTRQAVRALAAPDETEKDENPEGGSSLPSPGDTSSGAVPSLHEWAEILPVLGHVRSLGVAVVFTESGRRSSNMQHADLCFAVTREAVTNAVRHNNRLRQLAVAWDHDASRTTTVTVRSINDARTEAADRSTPSPTGVGLRRLQRAVEQSGGFMSYGWVTDEEWVVRAVVQISCETTSLTMPYRSTPREESR